MRRRKPKEMVLTVPAGEVRFNDGVQWPNDSGKNRWYRCLQNKRNFNGWNIYVKSEVTGEDFTINATMDQTLTVKRMV